MRRIFLVGYMGAGKSTLGRTLAHDLGLAFVDLDHYIENRYHTKISSLFAERGEAAFRQLESNILKEIGSFEDTLISTGGGTPLHFDNMDFMLDQGLVVYLKVSNERLTQRLIKAKDNRPLIAHKNDEEIAHFVEETMLVRDPQYARAHLTFDSDRFDSRHHLCHAQQQLLETVRAILETN